MNQQQVSLIVIILTFLAILSFKYIITNEGFETTTPETTTTTKSSNETSTSVGSGSTIQQKFAKDFNNFKLYLDRYKTIDIPITINNAGTICDEWGDNAEGKYKLDGNKCLLLPGRTIRQCKIGDNLTSCSNYYKDGIIDENNDIPTDQIYEIFNTRLQTKVEEIENEVSIKGEELNRLVNSVIEKRNTENQQLYFMEYNDVNVDDKKKYLDKATNQFTKLENDFLLNQTNFINTLNQNKKEEKENNLFYNILKYTIIIIIVLAILNFLISEIL